MSRPGAITEAEKMQRYYTAVSELRSIQPQVPVFQQDYRDVVRLLEEKILNFIRLNPKLRSHIGQRRRFLENKADGIFFNLIEFTESYRSRFVDGDFEGYCVKFALLFKPLLLEFIREIGFGGQDFRFVFRLQGQVFEYRYTVLDVEAD